MHCSSVSFQKTSKDELQIPWLKPLIGLIAMFSIIRGDWRSLWKCVHCNAKTSKPSGTWAKFGHWWLLMIIPSNECKLHIGELSQVYRLPPKHIFYYHRNIWTGSKLRTISENIDDNSSKDATFTSQHPGPPSLFTQRHYPAELWCGCYVWIFLDGFFPSGDRLVNCLTWVQYFSSRRSGSFLICHGFSIPIAGVVGSCLIFRIVLLFFKAIM